jgi:chemotaxis protein MotB
VSKKKHPEHVNHERWLVSYADFITLLFAFFVVLFASGQSDKRKQSQMAAAMATAFSPVSIFEPHTRQPALVDGTSASVAASVSAVTPLEQSIPRLRKLLAEQTRVARLPHGSLTMHTTSEGLVISLQEAGFFASGSADVQSRSLPVLVQLAAALPPGPKRVEGHTDNVPIHTTQFATNWELSSVRATTIARFLLEHNAADPVELAAAGYAEFHPVATNVTEEGRARNRRVDIILLSLPLQTRPAASQ